MTKANNWEWGVETVQKLTVMSRDNGSIFTDTTRLDAINQMLDKSSYRLTCSGDLYRIYAHQAFDPARPAILISTHADAVHQHHFVHHFTELLLGTFDNSVTNAVIAQLMIEAGFDPQVLIAFTGDEERDIKGAAQVAGWLRDQKITVPAVIVADVTHSGWKDAFDYTIENIFPEDSTQKVFAQTLCALLEDSVISRPLVVWEAVPDEAWLYRDLQFRCFSLCLPTDGNMHGPPGILLRKGSLLQYGGALCILANGLAQNPPQWS